MTKEEAFDIFCDEAEVTDPVTRVLRVKPIFMAAWRMCEADMLAKNEAMRNRLKECERILSTSSD